MELKTFIKETLIQIIDAVVEASEQAEPKGALINPRFAEALRPTPGPMRMHKSAPDPETVRSLGFFLTSDNRKADIVEFDIALSASSSAEESSVTSVGGKVGGGIRVVSAETAGSTSGTSRTNIAGERVSRVKFRIPIALPQQ